MDKLTKYENEKVLDALLDSKEFVALNLAWLNHQITNQDFIDRYQYLKTITAEEVLFIDHDDCMDAYKRVREAV
jgi:hypothetical protein